MHKGKKLSYSCMVGYTTESGTQDGRIICTAKGWSPVPQCYSELALFISSLLPAGAFPGCFSWDITEKKLPNRKDKMYRVQSIIYIKATQVYIWNIFTIIHILRAFTHLYIYFFFIRTLSFPVFLVWENYSFSLRCITF